MSLPTSEIRLRRFASQLYDLGGYAFYQFVREITAASSGAFDTLERYARLDPALVHTYAVEPPPLWRVK
jgi:hypothetical protein